jgi:hypothetical protein
MVLQSIFALVTLLPLSLATAVPTRRDGTAMYKIHPVGNNTLCLGTSWASNGQPVFVVDCDEYFPGYQNEWSVEKGDNLGVRVGYFDSQLPFCLDAGSTPENNGLVHMWTCYPRLQQQQCVSYCPRLVRLLMGVQLVLHGRPAPGDHRRQPVPRLGRRRWCDSSADISGASRAPRRCGRVKPVPSAQAETRIRCGISSLCSPSDSCGVSLSGAALRCHGEKPEFPALSIRESPLKRVRRIGGRLQGRN